MIALDHLGAFAPLFLQLERRLEEVHIEPGRRVEPGHHARRRDAVEPAISHQSSDDRAVLLLDEGLVVLLVGTRSRHLELLPATPGNDHLVHERTVVVEVDTAQQPREQALGALDRLDDEVAVTIDQRQALGPSGGNVHHRQSLDERARHRRAAMRHHVDLAEAGRWVLPVVERPDRHLTTDRGVEAGPTATAARGGHLHVAEDSVDRRGTHREQLRLLAFAELQPAVLLQCRQKGRDHRHEPLAAHTVRRLPQGRQRVLDRHAVAALALMRAVGLSCLLDDAPPQRPHRVLAMPARRPAQRVEDAPLLHPPRRPIALRHRRQNLAPRAHADTSRHERHRPDSAALLQSSAESSSVTFLVRVAVGTLIAERPPHRTVRAAFPHTAPTSGPNDTPRARWRMRPALVTRQRGAVSGTCFAELHSPWPRPLAPPTPRRIAPPRSPASQLLWPR